MFCTNTESLVYILSFIRFVRYNIANMRDYLNKKYSQNIVANGAYKGVLQYFVHLRKIYFECITHRPEVFVGNPSLLEG